MALREEVMPDTSSTKHSTPFNIHEYVATFFLTNSMLDYFDIVWAEEKSVTRKHDERYKTEFHMYLDEKDNRPEELKSLRPNGPVTKPIVLREEMTSFEHMRLQLFVVGELILFVLCHFFSLCSA